MYNQLDIFIFMGTPEEPRYIALGIPIATISSYENFWLPEKIHLFINSYRTHFFNPSGIPIRLYLFFPVFLLQFQLNFPYWQSRIWIFLLDLEIL